METRIYEYFETPIGRLLLAGEGENLVELGFPGGKAARRHEENWVEKPGAFHDVKKQLKDYFAGRLRSFDVPLAPCGTVFQLEVWEALREIPYGETVSYGELARRLGRPKASRAVGAANGKNPIPVIIPCHRVIGSSGKLVGFGGGLATKEILLNLERNTLAPPLLAG